MSQRLGSMICQAWYDDYYVRFIIPFRAETVVHQLRHTCIME
jgi:hypothetical protein